MLRTMHVEGEPVLDFGREDHRKLYDELCTFNDIEPRDSILEQAKEATVIADDNMVTEWHEPLLYPDLR